MTLIKYFMFDIPKPIPIKKVIVETPFVKTFVFEHTLNSKPGQFVNLWIPRVNEKPMSIAYDNGKEFWVTMFAVGPFSRMMHTLQAGDLVGVRGPYGSHFKYEKGQHLVMMAGGYGAAPLYNLTMKAAESGCSVDFVVGARSKEHLLYIDRIKKLKNVTLHIATDDGSVGEKGYNTLILERLLALSLRGVRRATKQPRLISTRLLRSDGLAMTEKKIDSVYGCGPEMMLKKVSDMCYAAGVKAQISIERYMKCGFGVCGQCCVDKTGERMCKEGPVVDNERARKITEFGKYHRDAVGRVHNF